MGDVICLVHIGKADKLQQHMNKIDLTGSIVFTLEDEKSMPFLDAKFMRKKYGRKREDYCVHEEGAH